MVELIDTKPLTKEFLESIGFYWHTDPDNSNYVNNQVVKVFQEEADNYYEATNELYDMFVTAGEYVIENELFHELNIPFNLVDVIKKSWEEDYHWHLYGRFDLAGGIDGKPIKLIEFNADTPTALLETSLIQWAMLKANELNEDYQFNNIYEAIRDNFKRLTVLNDSVEKFSNQGLKILFSSVEGSIEDENTVRYLQSIANEAGFTTEFAYVHDVGFDEREGIFFNEQKYEYWFKLIPWEVLAIDENDFNAVLNKIILNQKAILLNPAYTLIFQSKAFLKILWDLFPNHPLLLESSFEPLEGKKYVKKPTFAREGANVDIFDADNILIASNGGDYDGFNSVYQEFVEFPKDENGKYYQAGVFFAYEACGLGFRTGDLILNNYSKFAGHVIKK